MIDVPFTFRPIDQWPGELTQDRDRSPFSAPWSSTRQLLDRELAHLDAGNVVLQVAMRESDLRLDGRPRANAKASHPGVILAFESKHGPLQYVVDTYTTWEANLRGIALSLEKLRAVDRYGVTKRGEQYRGWKQLGAGGATEMPAAMTEHQAIDVLWKNAPGLTKMQVARDPRRAWRIATGQTHPDRGGDPAEFRRVQKAREVLS